MNKYEENMKYEGYMKNTYFFMIPSYYIPIFRSYFFIFFAYSLIFLYTFHILLHIPSYFPHISSLCPSTEWEEVGRGCTRGFPMIAWSLDMFSKAISPYDVINGVWEKGGGSVKTWNMLIWRNMKERSYVPSRGEGPIRRFEDDVALPPLYPG